LPQSDAILVQAKKWINRTGSIIEPPWEVIQADFVVATDAINAYLRQIEDALLPSNPRIMDIIKINKKFPGSGASSVLRKIGWELVKTDKASSILFEYDDEKHNAVFNINMVNEVVGEACRLLQQQNASKPLVILFDETATTPELASKFYEQLCANNGSKSKVLIVYVNNIVNQSVANQGEIVLEGFINPFLSINNACQVITKLELIIAESRTALSELAAHISAAERSNEQENRHIYVIMHVACNGKFVPAKSWLQSKLGLFIYDDLLIATILAVFSSFLPQNYRWLPKSSIQAKTTSSHLVDLIVHRQKLVSFLHPYIATLFLEICASRNIKSLIDTLDKALLEITFPAKELKEILKNLFFNRPQSNNFPSFITFLVGYDPKSPIDLLMRGECVKNYEKGFRCITASRIHKYHNLPNQYVEMVQFAEEAQEAFVGTIRHNLSLNNLAEVYGAATEAAINLQHREGVVDLYKKMNDTFVVLVDKTKNHQQDRDRVISQRDKWLAKNLENKIKQMV